ncbi:hypothetical protein SAMN04488493_1333 [Xylanibacter ruminicola]|uniref:hypothetical protein n=1 Tax=Xylanibacter ruminicola TaxID=839 RepID=UPI0008E5300E|nr:hypothetical protein [Xylanibacter ruminicola]SFC83300.1 hypothetical protein SAMN04488493_1333 [Xylanibacter ruminicola]
MDKVELSNKIARLNDLIIEANDLIKGIKDIINNPELNEGELDCRQYKDIRITEIQLSTQSLTSKFYTICDNNEILTLEDLLKISSNQFKKYRRSGQMMIEQVQDYLYKTYRIKW